MLLPESPGGNRAGPPGTQCSVVGRDARGGPAWTTVPLWSSFRGTARAGRTALGPCVVQVALLGASWLMSSGWESWGLWPWRALWSVPSCLGWLVPAFGTTGPTQVTEPRVPWSPPPGVEASAQLPRGLRPSAPSGKAWPRWCTGWRGLLCAPDWSLLPAQVVGGQGPPGQALLTQLPRGPQYQGFTINFWKELDRQGPGACRSPCRPLGPCAVSPTAGRGGASYPGHPPSPRHEPAASQWGGTCWAWQTGAAFFWPCLVFLGEGDGTCRSARVPAQGGRVGVSPVPGRVGVTCRMVTVGAVRSLARHAVCQGFSLPPGARFS